AVLDIDAGTSQYYSKEKLAQLLARLDEVGLRATLYQSSDSGGWHLYAPFDQKEQSKEVGQTLKRWLKALGYEIKGGQLEVFPGGNALRLPLQPGFAWLEQDGTLIRTRAELSRDEALALFLKDLKTDSRNWSEAKNLIESQIIEIDRAGDAGALAHEERLNIQGFEHVLCRGKIQETWEKGRTWWRNGLQASGERHNAILAVGHYLWFGDEEQNIAALPGSQNAEYRAQLIETWLKKNHNGYCSHLNRGDWKTVKEDIRRAAFWRREEVAWVREHYPLTDRLLKRLIALYKKTGVIWSIEQMERANEKRRLEARERIARAIESLKAEGLQISVAEVARRAKADWRTVKKNWDLMAYVLTSDNLEENRTIETETNKNLLACSGGVISLGGLSPATAFAAEVGDCLESVFVHRDTNTFSQDANITFQDLASEANYTITEIPKASPEPIKQRSAINHFNRKRLKKRFEHLALVRGSGSDCEFTVCSKVDPLSNIAIEPLLESVAPRIYFPLTEITKSLGITLVERAEARICFSVFETLRLKTFGATTNNSTACKVHTLRSSLAASLAPGSNTGALSAIASSAGGSSLGLAICSLNGFLPVPGPLHLPQTGFFLVAPARARDVAPGSEQSLQWRPTRFLGREPVLFMAPRVRRFLRNRILFIGSSERQSNRMWWQYDDGS
ncbi:MAG: hypothetical protein K2X81_12060, partial [Candidatus Obscuribacterales bacterium]|nr:hypothetical protein [Candidatus Obscuribacterales bacterium]